MAEVLVLAERSGVTPRKATLELLTLARRLGEPVALVCGPADEAFIRVLGQYGASRIYLVDDPVVTEFLVAPKADALVHVVGLTAPAAVLVTSSREGTEVAAANRWAGTDNKARATPQCRLRSPMRWWAS